MLHSRRPLGKCTATTRFNTGQRTSSNICLWKLLSTSGWRALFAGCLSRGANVSVGGQIDCFGQLSILIDISWTVRYEELCIRASHADLRFKILHQGMCLYTLNYT